MQGSEVLEELKKITKKLGLKSIEQLNNLVDALYSDVEQFYNNLDNISSFEFDNLEDYGKDIVKNMKLEIPKEVIDYINYEALAEDFIEKQNKDWAVFNNKIYIYPVD